MAALSVTKCSHVTLSALVSHLPPSLGCHPSTQHERHCGCSLADPPERHSERSSESRYFAFPKSHGYEQPQVQNYFFAVSAQKSHVKPQTQITSVQSVTY
jgi:hypothetical protein